MAHLSRFALAALAAMTFAAPSGTIQVALAQSSCEPGQPHCTPNGLLDPEDTPWPQIACRALGEDDNLTDDLRFTNVGDIVIRGGTRVFWQMLKTGESAWFTLPYDLPPTASVAAADLLSVGVPENTRCLTRIA